MTKLAHSKNSLKKGLKYLLSVSGILAICLCLGAPASAQDAQGVSDDMIATAAKGLLNPKFKIEDVRYVKELNMYRITVNNSYMHMTPDMRYAFVGDVVDVRAGRSILYSPKDIQFSDLPLEDAIKKGNGKHKIAVFIDPSCGFCKKQYQMLAGEKDLTVYYFLLGFMSNDSVAIASKIKGSKNPVATMDDFFLKDKRPDDAIKADETFLKRNADLAGKVNIRSTPTIFYEDGSSSIGFQPSANIHATINRIVSKGK